MASVESEPANVQGSVAVDVKTTFIAPPSFMCITIAPPIPTSYLLFSCGTEMYRARSYTREHQWSFATRQRDSYCRCESHRIGKQGPDAALDIEFLVAGKGFKPVADFVQLPSMIKVPTMTTRVALCGAGFSAGAADAKIESTQREEDCKPTVMGTLGGAFVAGDAVYAVTCVHNLQSGDTAGMFHPPGSSMYQPCAMGLTINGAGTKMESYDQLKQLECHHYAIRTHMDTVMDESENSFNCMIPSDCECGTIMGPIFGADVNVDVGVVQLLTGVELRERCCKSDQLKRGTLESPRLRLGHNATSILAPDDFPPLPFHVYGRGARSNDSMIATVDPTREETT
eukprot:gene27383-33074_t